jgi:hypothetical protein
MANIGVMGRVIDENGNGLTNLIVAAIDDLFFNGQKILRDTGTANDPVFPGLVKTGKNGAYQIN